CRGNRAGPLSQPASPWLATRHRPHEGRRDQMATRSVLESLDEAELRRLAEEIAFWLAPGDFVALAGDLGAGKTTLARALVTSLSGGRQEEMPSPTFTLVQTYDTARMPVAHLDLYRLADPA